MTKLPPDDPFSKRAASKDADPKDAAHKRTFSVRTSLGATLEATPSANPLLVRGQVLRLVNEFISLPSPSRIEKQALGEALEALNDRPTVCQVLVKELTQTTEGETRNRLAEILMAVGSVKLLQEPLWELIASATTEDALKDVAHLVLRQLGDETDPNLFLEYLNDPETLIGSETARMLGQAQTNPEAMVDFVDFILSLPIHEQLSLLQSLASEYPAAHQARLWEALWAHQPHERLSNWLETTLLGTDDSSLMPVLERLGRQFGVEKFKREARKSRLKGGDAIAVAAKHAIVEETQLNTCYATLPDGMGHQAFMVTRRHPNGDVCLMAVAVSHTQGLLDCFGFYQLSDVEVTQLVTKFHTTTLQIPLPPSMVKAWLEDAHRASVSQKRPIPYEYTLWCALLDDAPFLENSLPALLAESVTQQLQHTKSSWERMTHQLYLHPDFDTWFLEERDDETAAWLCEQALLVVSQALQGLSLQAPPENEADTFAKVQTTLETLGEAFVTAFWATETRHHLIERLKRAAFLLAAGEVGTFARLAATEAYRLESSSDTPIETPFIRDFVRRSMVEHLIRVVRFAPVLDKKASGTSIEDKAFRDKPTGKAATLHPVFMQPGGERLLEQVPLLKQWTEALYDAWFPPQDVPPSDEPLTLDDV
ncbi:MAG: hypothetical protein QE263_01420 [Vampirovibrionales bacterium]|nr:hypothetical protein [Vampirovibrionales bacterium]